MSAKEVRREYPCSPCEAAVLFDTTPAALCVFIGRERRRTGAKIVPRNGIRAERNARRRLKVLIGDVWLFEGKAVPWVRSPDAARRLETTECALRQKLRRKRRRTPDGWVSEYNGIPARTLGRCWLLCFEQKRSVSTSGRAGGAP